MDDSFLRAVEERFDRERPRWEGDPWKPRPFEGRWLELFSTAPGDYARGRTLVRDDGAVLEISSLPDIHHWNDVRDVLREIGDADPDQITTEIERRTEARDGEERLRLNVGDVFRLPIDAARVGYGQIVGRYGRTAYYFAIFEQAYEFGEEPEVADVVGGRIALLALSIDTLLYHGEWAIVGTAAVPPIDWPTYKEAVAPDVWDAVDHTGTARRPVERSDADGLPIRSVVRPDPSPERFPFSLHGVGEWNDAYDPAALPLT